MLKLFRRKKEMATNQEKSNKSERPRPVLQKVGARPQAVTDQTLEYLKAADPDDILELMLPGLVQEQQRRLASTARELEEIDRKLAKLHASRDDVYSVMKEKHNNGVADF